MRIAHQQKCVTVSWGLLEGRQRNQTIPPGLGFDHNLLPDLDGKLFGQQTHSKIGSEARSKRRHHPNWFREHRY